MKLICMLTLLFLLTKDISESESSETLKFDHIAETNVKYV